MRKISLTRGLVAFVDDEDFERLSQFNWYAEQCKSGYYATRGNWRDGRNFTTRMHREAVLAPPGCAIDHIDHNGLNNQKSNLRLCSTSQNNFNQRLGRRNTSGFKGVSWDKSKNKWSAQLGLNGKIVHLGRFCSAIEAATAYDDNAVIHFGEFALTNAMLGLL